MPLQFWPQVSDASLRLFSASVCEEFHEKLRRVLQSLPGFHPVVLLPPLQLRKAEIGYLKIRSSGQFPSAHGLDMKPPSCLLLVVGSTSLLMLVLS